MWVFSFFFYEFCFMILLTIWQNVFFLLFFMSTFSLLLTAHDFSLINYSFRDEMLCCSTKWITTFYFLLSAFFPELQVPERMQTSSFFLLWFLVPAINVTKDGCLPDSSVHVRCFPNKTTLGTVVEFVSLGYFSIVFYGQRKKEASSIPCLIFF